jgi:hypothetical protein
MIYRNYIPAYMRFIIKLVINIKNAIPLFANIIYYKNIYFIVLIHIINLINLYNDNLII